jgi:drug/metabolite transporter (DMT)-like permease
VAPVDARPGLAVGAAGLAALLWSTYYPFVLALPPGEALPILVFAPIFGGLCSLTIHVISRGSPLRALGRDAGNARIGGAGLLFFAFNALAIPAARLVGAVNTSLVVLASDLLGTPFLYYAIWRDGGERLKRRSFWIGVGLIGAGAALAILAGGTTEPVSTATIAIGIPLFVVNSALILLLDAAIRSRPMSAVLAVAFLLAAAAAAAVGTVVAGPRAMLGVWDVRTAVLLVAFGITNFSAAPLLFFWSVRTLSLVLPSVLQAAIPVFTLLLVLALGLQPVTVFAAVGAPLAFVGALAAIGGLRRTPVREAAPIAPVP